MFDIHRLLPDRLRPRTAKPRNNILNRVWFTPTDVIGRLYPNQTELEALAHQTKKAKN